MLNQITLMGRLTKDPILRYTQSQTPVASFTLAVDRDTVNKQTGERGVDFIDITAWRQTAEFAERYFFKGDMVIISGRLQMQSYTDKQGQNRTKAEVVAEHVYFGQSKQKGGNETRGRVAQAPVNVDASDFADLDDDEPLPWE